MTISVKREIQKTFELLLTLSDWLWPISVQLHEFIYRRYYQPFGPISGQFVQSPRNVLQQCRIQAVDRRTIEFQCGDAGFVIDGHIDQPIGALR